MQGDHMFLLYGDCPTLMLLVPCPNKYHYTVKSQSGTPQFLLKTQKTSLKMFSQSLYFQLQNKVWCGFANYIKCPSAELWKHVAVFSCSSVTPPLGL